MAGTEFLMREADNAARTAGKSEEEIMRSQVELRKKILERQAGKNFDRENELENFLSDPEMGLSDDLVARFRDFITETNPENKFKQQINNLQGGITDEELRGYLNNDNEVINNMKKKQIDQLINDTAFKQHKMSNTLNNKGIKPELQDKINNQLKDAKIEETMEVPIEKNSKITVIKKNGEPISHIIKTEKGETIIFDTLGNALPKDGTSVKDLSIEELDAFFDNKFNQIRKKECLLNPMCADEAANTLEGGKPKTRSERRNERRKERERKKNEKKKDGFAKKWFKRGLETGAIAAGVTGAMIVRDADREHNIKSCQSLCNEHTYFCGPSPNSSDSSITIQSYNDILNPNNFSDNFIKSVKQKDGTPLGTPEQFFEFCYENSKNGNINEDDETNGCNIWKRYMCIIDNFHECYGNNIIKDQSDSNPINCDSGSSNWTQVGGVQPDSKYCKKPGNPNCIDLLSEQPNLTKAFGGNDCRSCIPQEESLYNKCDIMSNEEFYSVENLVYFFMKYNDEDIKGCTQPINNNNDTLPCMPSRSELEKIDASAPPGAPKLADVCSHRINEGQSDQEGDIEREAFYLLGASLSPVGGTEIAVGGTIVNAFLTAEDVSREYAIQQLSQIKNKHIQSKDEIDWVCNTVLPDIAGNKGYTPQKIPKKVVDNMMKNAAPADKPFELMSDIGNMFGSELTGNDLQDGWVDFKSTLSHTPVVGNLLDDCTEITDMKKIYEARDKQVGECNNNSSPPIPCWDNPAKSRMLNLDYPNPEDLKCFKNSERSLSKVCNFQKNRYDTNLELTKTLEDCFNSFTDLFTNIFSGPHSLSNIDFWDSFNNNHENNPSGNIPPLTHDGIIKLINNNLKNKCSSKFLCHILTDNEEQCSHVLKFINNIFAVIFYILLIIYIIAINKKILNFKKIKIKHTASLIFNKFILIIISLFILLNILYIAIHSSNENSSINSYTFKGFMEMFAFSNIKANNFSDTLLNLFFPFFISTLLGFITYNSISNFIPINPIILMIGLTCVFTGLLIGIGSYIKQNNDTEETDSSSSLGNHLIKYESLSTIIQLIVVLLIIGHLFFYNIENLKDFANKGYKITKGSLKATSKFAKQKAVRTYKYIKKNKTKSSEDI